MNYLKITSAAAFILGLPQPALAHPHIFVRYDVAIEPASAGYIKLHFTFKINAAANLLTPGVQSAGQSAAWQPRTCWPISPRIRSFFISIWMAKAWDGRKCATLSGHNDEYVFDLTLPDTGGNLSFALYDPEYFVSVSQNGEGAMAVKVDMI